MADNTRGIGGQAEAGQGRTGNGTVSDGDAPVQQPPAVVPSEDN